METLALLVLLFFVLLIIFISYKIKHKTKILRNRILSGENGMYGNYYDDNGEKNRCKILCLDNDGLLILTFYGNEKIYTSIENIYAF